MSIYRPLTKIAVALSLLFVVFLAIDPFTGFGQIVEPPNIIGNRIYCDNNLDGQLSGGEFIAGVTVEVSLWSSPFVSSTVTDASGNYLFTGLPVDPSVSNFITDAYTVTVDIATLPPECNVPAVDPDGVLDNMSIVVFDANRTDNRAMDFGYKAPPGIVAGQSDIGNRVYCDADLSGDATNLSHSERIPGAEVTITNIGGFSDSMLTDDTGNYLFENIAAGTYTVTVDAGTLPAACSIPFIDGDSVISATGATSVTVNLDNQSVITLLPSQDNYAQDFGYEPTAPLALVGDKIWCDVDGDLTQDAGEGIGNVSITITENVTTTPVIYNTMSGPTGLYQFINLAAGDYTVSVDPLTLPASCNTPFAAGDPDGIADNATSFTITAGQLNYGIDIGYSGSLPVSDIGGKSWCETTINGVYDVGEIVFDGRTVSLTNSAGVSTTMMTDASGDYLFANLEPDTYTVAYDSSTLPVTCNAPSVDPDGTFDNQTEVVLVAAVDQLDVNFAYEAPPVATAVPTEIPTEVPTEVPTAVPTEVPTEMPTALPTEMPTAMPTTVPTEMPTSVPTAVLTGTVTAVPANTATAVPANTAVPTEMPTGMPTSLPTATVTSMPTATNTPIPPTPAPGQPGSIGDTIWCDNNGNGMLDAGEGIENATVTLVDKDNNISSKTTDSTGNYLFDDLTSGTYTIVVSNIPTTCSEAISEPDSTLDGTTLVNLVAGETNSNIDFMFRAPTATISDVIWNDANGDGIQDGTEAGLVGVTIELFDTSDAKLQEAITDVNGKYTLEGIAPTQQYYMIFTLPDGWQIAAQGASDLNTTINTSTGRTGVFGVNPGAAGVQFAVAVAPEGEVSESQSTYLPFTTR